MGIAFESHVLLSLSLFSRYTTYEIRYTIHGGEGGIPSPPSLSLLLRSRPPSLSFASLILPPPEAFGLASNPYGHKKAGGEGGIRTLGKALDPPHDFQSCTFDRSVTSPIADVLLYQELAKEQPKLRSSGMFSVKYFTEN